MSKVLSIVGPTAVGKTDFAWSVADELWQKYQVSCDVIAADSRQVYRGLETLSGADVPTIARWSGDHWQVGQHRLWGVSIIETTQEWSVAHFRRYAQQVCENAWRENYLPILVGGTGLYSDLAMSADPLLDVKPSQDIRDKVAVMELEELQTWVKQVAAVRWEQMNESDRANPRRLVRALEHQLAEPVVLPPVKIRENVDQLVIGITDDLEKIVSKIAQRVQQRWVSGAKAEVERLLVNQESNQPLPALTTTGVKQIAAHLAGELSESTLLELWTTAERQYAKRQLTWWKKRPGLTWYELAHPDWQKDALSQITAWYHSN